MASINYATREISCKIVYYGPGLSGKTTNLQIIHKKIPQETKSEMVSLATETDRTLFFDFLPLDLGSIKGFATKFQLYTVPGQVYYNATRKLVLRGVDGVVFVADSQRDKMAENLESLKNLQDNLKEYGIDLGTVPFVLQYNKRDLPSVFTVEEMSAQINSWGVPCYEAVAHQGVGVFTTLKAIGKVVIDTFNTKYAARQSSRRPPVEAQPAPPRPAAPPPMAAPVPPPPMAPAPRPAPMPPPPPPRPAAAPVAAPPMPPPPPPAPRPQPAPLASSPLPGLVSGFDTPAVPVRQPAAAPLPGMVSGFDTPTIPVRQPAAAPLPGLVSGFDTPAVPTRQPTAAAPLPGLVSGFGDAPPPPSLASSPLPGLQTFGAPPPAPPAAPITPPPVAGHGSTGHSSSGSTKKSRLDGSMDPDDLDAEIARYERELAEQQARQRPLAPPPPPPPPPSSTARVTSAPPINPNIELDPLNSAFLSPEEIQTLQQQEYPTRRMPFGPGTSN